MLKERTRFLLAYGLPGLLGLTPLSCGGRSGLLVSRPGGAGSSGSGDPTRISPSDDGSCPGTTSLCGAGPGARCYALDSDPMNCGACARACTPGVACASGMCRQPRCTGPVSFQQIASFPSILAPNDTNGLWGYMGADMNRDGHLDLIEFSTGGDLVIWLGHGDGTFDASSSYATSGGADTWALPGYAAVGDFNEDGLADLVVTPDNDKVEIRPGISGGGLGGHAGLPLASVFVADLDGDGHLDVIDGHSDKNGDPTGFTVLLGRGDGTFATGSNYAVRANDQWWPWELRDWDGDGTLDLIGVGMTVHVLPGKGDGTFAEPQRCALSFGAEPWLAATFADLNRDGRVDAVWVMWPGQSMTTVLGSGDCGFSPRTDYPLAFQPSALGIGDLSGDGVLDLVLPSQEGARTALLLGKSDGTFVTQPELSLDMSGQVFIADVTDDGIPDIVSTSARGIVVFANTCSH